MIELHHGDCIEVMRTLPDNSVDSIVTDPPYGLSSTSPERVTETIVAWATGDRDYIPAGKGFMGKSWDAFVPPPALWDEAMRVLKPGGHLLAFAGTRTQDLMGLSIRLAGFEIRENLAWLHGQGFPKSMDVGKAIDKAAGVEREVIGSKLGQPGYHLTATPTPDGVLGNHLRQTTADSRLGASQITAPATPSAQQWQGWGTALKPAFEPIVMARKPLIGTVAANVQAHGTGALNIDATRIGETVETWPATRRYGGGRGSAAEASAVAFGRDSSEARTQSTGEAPAGRWPANVALDEHMAAVLDGQSGVSKSKSGGLSTKALGIMNDDGWAARDVPRTGHDDSGGASRFFYVAKAPKKERPVVDGVAHATVKPLALMRWLVRLVTPEGGTVLEPFAGSGTTVEACILEGFNCIAIEREAEYLPLIQARIDRQEAA